MKQFYLTEITTKDSLVHQGIYFEPKKKEKRAILWVHGLTSTFYAGVKTVNTMADVCEKYGWGFASFNPQAKKPWYTFPFLKFLLAIRRGDFLLTTVSFFPATAKRFLSLLTPGLAEDVFDYGDTKPKLTVFSKLIKPLFIILAGSDETADRPLEQIKKVFDDHTKSKKYKSIIVPNASHTFTGSEDALVSAIFSWVKTV